jgi:hypothetical protein
MGVCFVERPSITGVVGDIIVMAAPPRRPQTPSEQRRCTSRPNPPIPADDRVHARASKANRVEQLLLVCVFQLRRRQRLPTIELIVTHFLAVRVAAGIFSRASAHTRLTSICHAPSSGCDARSFMPLPSSSPGSVSVLDGRASSQRSMLPMANLWPSSAPSPAKNFALRPIGPRTA